MSPSDRLDALRTACAEPLPHPELAQLWHMSQGVVDFALDEFGALPEIDPATTAARAEMERLLREPPPEGGADFADVLAEFRQRVAPNNMRPSHPRFLAFVPAAPTYISVLGDWLCAATNLFAGMWKESPGAAEVEIVVLDWFKELMGYPPEAAGLLTSGGSEANLTALVVAREHLAQEARGRAVLYMSDQRHWSVDRAAMVIGLRPDQVRVLPARDDFTLAPETLERAVEQDRRAGRIPWVAVALAGTTNTGAVDPLDRLADVCRRQDLWLHVDAAYGWPVVLTERGRDELRGLARADSVTLDTHKWLAQTYVAGCLLVRRGAWLEETFAARPEYLQDLGPEPGEVNFADRGLALSRRFRALKIWLSFKVLGVAWFRQLVEHTCRLAELAEGLLEQSGPFAIVSRRLSTLCFRLVARGADEITGDALNRALCEELQRSGRAFLATTRLHGRTVLRMCFVNWRATAADVEEVVGLLRDIGARLARE